MSYKITKRATEEKREKRRNCAHKGKERKNHRSKCDNEHRRENETRNRRRENERNIIKVKRRKRRSRRKKRMTRKQREVREPCKHGGNARHLAIRLPVFNLLFNHQPRPDKQVL